MLKISLIFTIILSITGCATTYQSAGLSGGFSEVQLDKNVWRVTFEGNGYTKGQRSEDMALLRSAELTLLQGFTHFAFIDSRTSTETFSISNPSTSHSTFNATSFGGSIQGTARTRIYGGGTTIINKPQATNTVMMFSEKPNINSMVYDANFVCLNVGKKYEVICGIKK